LKDLLSSFQEPHKRTEAFAAVASPCGFVQHDDCDFVEAKKEEGRRQGEHKKGDMLQAPLTFFVSSLKRQILLVEV